ncbi:carboxymuconolactone decarboxylase family protein [Heyndrickxia sp. NPDC080065]|uniref:carboxymuconolactone decarboxylase family protein n=1 Tax=Heyndrickxia sp. NPDC080065 TaxID=3390568 RepID=UPI003D066C50
MTKIYESKTGETSIKKYLMHNKDAMSGWLRLKEMFEKRGILSSNLKKQVRNTILYPDSSNKSKSDLCNDKIFVAVDFAEKFMLQKRELSSTTISMLREFFTKQEISELCAFIVFTSASRDLEVMLSSVLSENSVNEIDSRNWKEYFMEIVKSIMLYK